MLISVNYNVKGYTLISMPGAFGISFSLQVSSHFNLESPFLYKYHRTLNSANFLGHVILVNWTIHMSGFIYL